MGVLGVSPNKRFLCPLGHEICACLPPYRKELKITMDKAPKKAEVHIRISTEEKRKLKKKALQANMTMSKYILSLSENKKIYKVNDLPKLIFEISKIGTNINQIVHSTNYERRVSQSDIEALQNRLTKIQDILLKLIDELSNSEEKNNGVCKVDEAENKNS